MKNRFSPSSTPKQDSPRKDPSPGDHVLPNGSPPSHPLQPYFGLHSHAGNLESSVPLPDMGPYGSLYLSPFKHTSHVPDIGQHASTNGSTPGQHSMLPAASTPMWFHRRSSGLPQQPAGGVESAFGSHSGPLLVHRRETSQEGRGKPSLQMTTSRSMPSLRDAEAGDAAVAPASTAKPGQVPGASSWDPQVRAFCTWCLSFAVLSTLLFTAPRSRQTHDSIFALSWLPCRCL